MERIEDEMSCIAMPPTVRRAGFTYSYLAYLTNLGQDWVFCALYSDTDIGQGRCEQPYRDAIIRDCQTLFFGIRWPLGAIAYHQRMIELNLLTGMVLCIS